MHSNILSPQQAKQPSPTKLSTAVKLVCASFLYAAVAVPVVWSANANAATEPTKAEQQANFNIPAGPLAEALNQFAAASGIYLSGNGALTQNKRSAGLVGKYSTHDALVKLLDGSGVTFKLVGSTATLEVGTVEVETLSVVEVNDSLVEESAYGSVDGYVAKRSATATKTDTPIIESAQSISVITRDQMDVQGVQSVGDALRYTAGVLAESNGPDPRADVIVVRGLESGGRDQFRDGLRVFSFGNQNGTTLEPYALERIEVLKGPSSILYGQGSPGGLVNLVSKRPTEEPLHEIQATYGTFDRKQIVGDFSGPLAGSDDWSYRLTGLVRDSDTQIDYIKDDAVYIAPAVTWRPSDHTSLTLLTNFQKTKRTQGFQAWPRVGTLDSNPNGKIKADRFLGQPNFDKLDQEQYSLGYLFEHDFNDMFSFRQNTRYFNARSRINTIFGTGLQADLRTINRIGRKKTENVRNFTIDNHLQMSLDHGVFEHTILLGLDYQDAKDRIINTNFAAFDSLDVFNPVYSTNTPSFTIGRDEKQTLEQTGVYLQNQLKINKKWVATLSLREDNTKQSTTDILAGGTTTKQKDDAFTWRTGLVYLADNGLAPYASYSESFIPTAGTAFDGGQFKPETGEQYEVGIRYQPENTNISLTASIFDISQQNLTTADLLNPGFSVQRGEVESKGFELEGKANLTNGLSVIASYTYVDAEVSKSNDGLKGKLLPATPKNAASIWLDYDLPNHLIAGLTMGGGVRYIGTTEGDAENTFTIPSYTLVDMALNYDLTAFDASLSGWRLALNASNVFDKKYVAKCGFFADSCKFGYRRSATGTLSYHW